MLWFYFIFTFCFSLFLTPLIIFVMRHLGIVDRPTQERKIHKKNISLGGGVAIFFSFFLLIFFALKWGNLGSDITSTNIIGIFLGALVLIIGGLIDDKYNLRPFQQIWFPIVASIIPLMFGIGLETVTHPSGGVLHLNQIRIPIEGLGNWVVLADTLVFFWLMTMMLTTKLLDGMDGLAVGIVTIGAIVVFFLSREAQWFQPEVTLFSLIFIASCLGFLVWNFHPAKVFLGEGGSLFIGYMLGILAIISGSKIATTLLVMGIPMLDVVRVMYMRLRKKKPLFLGDSEHLHFRLLASGLGHRQTVLLLYSIAFVFGISTLFLQSHQKLIALSFLFILMLLIALWFSHKDSRS